MRCVYAGHGLISQYSGQSESFGSEPSLETQTQINECLTTCFPWMPFAQFICDIKYTTVLLHFI